MPNVRRPADLRQDETLVGRGDELDQLVRTLARGRHALLVGEKGMGKSRLLLEARRLLAGRSKRLETAPGVVAGQRGELGVRIRPEDRRVIMVEHAAPLGACLQEILERLFEFGDLALDPDGERTDWEGARKQISGLGSVALQSLIVESIAKSSRPYVLLFDSLDRLSPTQAQFLETLLQIAVVGAAVVRVKENPLLRRVWSSFVRIDLEPLAGEEERALVDHLSAGVAIRASDAILYRKELRRAAAGNPFALRTMAWHASRERSVSLEEIRGLRRGDRAAYFNMGPIYIFAFAMFTLIRIFSIGLDNTEFYIYFSALGFIAYLIFRVFRAFFLFRPQKFQ